MAFHLNDTQAELLAKRVMGYCETLASFTQTKGIVDRRYLSPEHQQTNQQLQEWALKFGLEHWSDQAGNQWLRLPCANLDAKRLILGSHSDTVPNGGKYDGMLGILAPLVLLQSLKEQGASFAFHIDVVAFGDEEGTRFGATLLGSSAIAGKWKESWLDLKDNNGICLAHALEDFGLDSKAVASSTIDPVSILAYMETHIEQGPVLEAKQQALAAVSGIAGASRFNISLTSKAGHAGTVPMQMRSDPLVLASTWIAELNQKVLATVGTEHPVVATVGRLKVSPGGVNVIPGKVELSLDIRSLSDPSRLSLAQELLQNLSEKALSLGITISIEQSHDAAAVACDPKLTKIIVEVLESLGHKGLVLPSGAGHDAMVFADVVPTAMLFVRCKGGISHHPDESITINDVAASLLAISGFISRF
ncbi:allantoate amidohydrolase [Alginatibacterium sediminis]|uniref:Allantoate amidohydrolase n=1 Tax=Alginatibacterium sediminis TaxID=2164068 RepID=A0A420EGQ6_9ALTE|nr:allantoate amidohydrolase [Alginatibacterium sediminis]RKF19901.1 allantoate amidohydrolase [Alginatibacterium sediminis]